MDFLTKIDVATFVVLSALYITLLGMPAYAAVKWVLQRIRRRR